VLRFFESELANEASWMLPFALAAVVLGLFSAKVRLPLEANTHKALLLWGGWLLTCVVFFSVAAFFHAYYLMMLAPALGGSVALGASVLEEWWKTRPTLAGLVLAAVGTLTLIIQVFMVGLYGVSGWYVWGGGVVCASGVILAMAGLKIPKLRNASIGLVMAGLLVIPLVWSFLTVNVEQPNVNLPSAYAGENDGRARVQQAAGLQQNARPQQIEGDRDNGLVEFLLANQTGEYLVAVPSSNQGSNMVLETGEPVLYMGGFNGGDPVVDAGDLSDLVSAGDLTYVLYGESGNRGQGQQNGIAQWLQASCTVVPQFSQSNRMARSVQPAPRSQGGMTLYECMR